MLTEILAEPQSRLNLFRFFMGFGPEQLSSQNISFNPEAGKYLREQYEKKYGPRGELLIERFGKGLAPDNTPILIDDDIFEVILRDSNNKQLLCFIY